MKNELNFKPIKTKDIPAVVHKKMHAVQAGVRAFYESDAEAVEVEWKGSYKTIVSALNALTVGIKREGLKGFVKAIQRRGRVFLVRVWAKNKI